MSISKEGKSPKDWEAILENSLITHTPLATSSQIRLWADKMITQVESGNLDVAMVNIAFNLARLGRSSANYALAYFKLKSVENPTAAWISKFGEYVINIKRKHGSGIRYLQESDIVAPDEHPAPHPENYVMAAWYGVVRGLNENQEIANSLVSRMSSI